jgi:S-adenosylmethionine:tRNA ribosyltransferase-isomerase
VIKYFERKIMDIKEIDYYLPPELIAQKPQSRREKSRLMLIERKTGKISHHLFLDILSPSEVLVLNNTKVIKARLFGKRATGAKVEIFLLEQIKNNLWKVLLNPANRLKENEEIYLTTQLKAKIIKKYLDPMTHLVDFECSNNFWDILEKVGEVPFPPYIKVKGNDKYLEKRYQTVFGRENGSVAAPTASLHFSHNLLHKIREKGIKLERLTMHVGLGTFLPIKTQNVFEHQMHKEWYNIKIKTVNSLNEAKTQGKKIVAVGSTVARTLETIYKDNKLIAGGGFTDIYIYPGYKFKAVDMLLTNFHLPKSTLLLLVWAFGGKELMKEAYLKAIEEKYRFYSFGDAMLII